MGIWLKRLGSSWAKWWNTLKLKSTQHRSTNSWNALYMAGYFKIPQITFKFNESAPRTHFLIFVFLTSEEEFAPAAEWAWRLFALLQLLSPPPPEEVLWNWALVLGSGLPGVKDKPLGIPRRLGNMHTFESILL